MVPQYTGPDKEVGDPEVQRSSSKGLGGREGRGPIRGRVAMRSADTAWAVLGSRLARPVSEAEPGAARPAGRGEGTDGGEDAKHPSRSPEGHTRTPPTEHVSGSLISRQVSLQAGASGSCSYALSEAFGVADQRDQLPLRDERTSPTRRGDACEQNAIDRFCLPDADEIACQAPPQQIQFHYGFSVALFHKPGGFRGRKPGGVVRRR